MNVTIAVFCLLWLGTLCCQAQPPLKLEREIALPESTGKFDHFAIDLEANRLFIAATGNHTVEILDLNTDQVVETITGLGKPHGLAWIPATKQLYASDGTHGEVKVFADSPLRQAQSVELSEDADDMVYDPRSKLLYVGHGGGAAANPAGVAVIDTTRQSLVNNLPVATHPEGMDIDVARDRIFVNVADSAAIAIIDGATHSLSAAWKITRAKDNVPVAFDPDHNLLFVGCRTPGRLVVLDGESGKEVSDLPAHEGADDLFYDAEFQRVYLIAGSGAIDVYQVDANRTVRPLGFTATSAGAKTGLLVPSQHAIYVGAGATGPKPAEIRVYSTR